MKRYLHNYPASLCLPKMIKNNFPPFSTLFSKKKKIVQQLQPIKKKKIANQNFSFFSLATIKTSSKKSIKKTHLIPFDGWIGFAFNFTVQSGWFTFLHHQIAGMFNYPRRTILSWKKIKKRKKT